MEFLSTCKIHDDIEGMCLNVIFNVKQEQEAEENNCNLKDLREGLVGKMLVRKSGRVQLILGQVTLDVSLGTTCSFLQV